MTSYEGIQDVLTAVLVIIAISVVVAVAWLSTHVREQPLVATAFFVFHSGVNGERERPQEEGETRQGAGDNLGEAATPLRAATQVKESENSASVQQQEADMEVRPVAEGETKQECDIDVSRAEQVSTNTLDTKNSLENLCPEEAHTNLDLRQERSPLQMSEQSAQSSSPSDLPPLQRMKESMPEMEVRQRRLQHFISMGQSDTATPSSSTASPTPSTCQPSPLAPHSDTDIDVTQSLHKTSEEEARPVTDGATTAEPQVEEQERPPGSIKIRLKFLDETQRFVFAQLTEQVGTFKRQHFSIEMDDNRHIRLIFNGKLLSQDSSTLAHYGLFDNCVVHCHVSQPQPPHNTSGQAGEVAIQEEEDPYVSNLLAPLLYFVMVVMWYLRYEYGYLFNTMSSVILLFLTGLLLISTYLLYISQNVPETGTSGTRARSPRPSTHNPAA